MGIRRFFTFSTVCSVLSLILVLTTTVLLMPCILWITGIKPAMTRFFVVEIVVDRPWPGRGLSTPAAYPQTIHLGFSGYPPLVPKARRSANRSPKAECMGRAGIPMAGSHRPTGPLRSWSAISLTTEAREGSSEIMSSVLVHACMTVVWSWRLNSEAMC